MLELFKTYSEAVNAMLAAFAVKDCWCDCPTVAEPPSTAQAALELHRALHDLWRGIGTVLHQTLAVSEDKC